MDTAPTAPTSLTLRNTLAIPRPKSPVLTTARRITTGWLEEKFGAVPLGSGQHPIKDGVSLVNQVLYRSDAEEYAFRIQLRETAPTATWRTTITALAPHEQSATISVLLEAFPQGGARITPGRPRFVRDLVRELAPRDGLARLTVNAQRVQDGDIDPLIEVLCDPGRQLPMIVAARPYQPDSRWSQWMSKAMPNCAGSASLFILDDLTTVHAFRKAVGEHHRVAPGSVRTFLPDVDPAWEPDGARHRFISYARITDAANDSWLGIARRAQVHANHAPVPERLRTIAWPDPGQHHREQRQAALTTDRSTREIEAMRSDIAVLTALLAQADLDLKEAQVNAELAARTINTLETDLEEANSTALGDIEDALAGWDAAERARAEADELRARLHRDGRSEETVIIEEFPGTPRSFAELLDRAIALTHLTITADHAKALALDDNDRARSWASRGWNGLRALNDYAKSVSEGLFTSDFARYCTDTTPGAKWPYRALATGETTQTMSRWGHERIFPVPKQYHPDERAEMTPHLKIDRNGVAPRIYFLDDTRGTTNSIIIGYIGPHLTNTHTN